MENDDKKKPRFRPDNDASPINKKENDDNDELFEMACLPPFTSEFIDSLDYQDDDESAELYKQALRRAPGFPWSQDEEEDEMIATPNLLAPFLSGANADGITPDQIVAGVYVNIPRSRMLWTGDQLKLIWGQNTFYTTLDSTPCIDEPRLVHYINCDQLAHYQNGEVHIHYEVVRRSRLVGISQPLTVYVEGYGRPRSGPRRRSVRRRGY